MGKKKKWYVVVVGKEVGVFETWLEVAGLISGVSGALYESFSSLEEAIRVFEGEQAKGNTRVVGSSISARAPVGPSVVPAFSANSSPSTPSSVRLHVRSTHSTPGTSSPRMPLTSHLQSHSRQRSIHNTSPRGLRSRSPSPTVFHANVSYTRRTSTSARASPRDIQHSTPRVFVETPNELTSYPNVIESATSTPLSQRGSQSRRRVYESHIQASPARIDPSLVLSKHSPLNTSRGVSRTVLVQTPSGMESYLDDGYESASAPHTPLSAVNKGVQAGPTLSPLASPRFYTPPARPRQKIPRHPSKNSSNGSHKSDLGSQHNPSPDIASITGAVFPSYQSPPFHIHLQVMPVDHTGRCQHCSDCPEHVAGSVPQFGLPQPFQIPSVLFEDPRSPITRSGKRSSVASQRPSPHVKVEAFEEQIGNLYL